MALLISDPVCIAMDKDNNLVRRGGRLVRASGLDACVQGARFRMQLVAGELFWNRDAGMKLLAVKGLVTEDEALLGQTYDELKTRAAFRRPILATPGINSILLLRIVFVPETRSLGVTWAANTLFGDTPIDTFDPLAALAGGNR